MNVWGINVRDVLWERKFSHVTLSLMEDLRDGIIYSVIDVIRIMGQFGHLFALFNKIRKFREMPYQEP